MRYTGLIVILLPLVLAGCTQYANIDQVQIGMSLNEFTQLQTPLNFRGTSGDYTQYSCKLRVPYQQALSSTAIRPYVLTFKEGTLTEIEIDENELNRQAIRQNVNYNVGFYGHSHYRP